MDCSSDSQFSLDEEFVEEEMDELLQQLGGPPTPPPNRELDWELALHYVAEQGDDNSPPLPIDAVEGSTSPLQEWSCGDADALLEMLEVPEDPYFESWSPETFHSILETEEVELLSEACLSDGEFG